MADSRFWKPKSKFNFSLPKIKLPFGKKQVGSTPSVGVNRPQVKKDFGAFFKKMGLAGGISLGVLGVIVLLVFIFIVKPASVVLLQVNKLKGDREALDRAFLAQDIPGINAALDKLGANLEETRGVRDDNLGWTKNFPATKAYYYDSEHFINSGVYLVDALKEFVTVVSPFADAAGFKLKDDVTVNDPNSPTGLADAVATWVKVMPEVADKMDGVIEKFDKVGTEMEYIDAERYPETFNGSALKSNIIGAQQYLAKAKDFGPDIKAALTTIPPVVGVGGTLEKRYAIIMQNDKELRPTGGFITNVGSFKIKDAKLASDFTTFDSYSIDETIALTDTAYTSPFPKPYAPYRQFLKVEHTYSRDSNFSPDFVTAMDAWHWYYKRAAAIGHPDAKPINGIIAMDTTVVSELLKVTGPVNINANGINQTFDSENVVLELEKIASLNLREQQNRKKVLGDLMEEMLIKMYKSEKNLCPKFVETGIRLAMQKHIQVYIFDDPKAQALLEKYNFAGRIMPYDKGDYSFVVSSNLGGDKTNGFVSKVVDHKITQEGGKVLHEVSINYTYNEPPAGWEPLAAVYRDWVRVYVPAGSKLVSIDGSDATTEADYGEERGKVYFAGHITLPPREKKNITFKYEVPSSVIKDGVYNLYLQKQAGVDTDKATVSIWGDMQTVDLLMDKEVSFKSGVKSSSK